MLFILCLHLAPRRILDLGSGFSSYVFRLYAGVCGKDCEVVTMDDSAEWLVKTETFLNTQCLETENCLLWDPQTPLGAEKFDIILHDLGDMQLRAATLPVVLCGTSSNGCIILDDMHYPDYRETALKSVAEQRLVIFDLHDETLDEFGRYASIVHRPHSGRGIHANVRNIQN